MKDDTNPNIDFLQQLLADWRRIIPFAAFGLVGGIAYAFLMPKWYTADLSVVPSVSSKGPSLGGLSGAAAALTELPIDLGGSDVDRIAAIFHSSSVTDAVIAKYNLKDRYNVRYREDAREELWKHCSTKIEKKPNVVTLSCEDKSPQQAQAIVAFFADYANQVALRVATSSAREERKFLEKRVSQAKADLDKASRELRDFQEANKIVSLPEQAKAVVASMATIRAEILEKQLQLSFVDGFTSTDESTSGQLRRQVGLLQGKLKTLEEDKSAANRSALNAHTPGSPAASKPRNTGGIFPPAMNVPKLQYELEYLLREQKIQETLLMLLTQRYEIARVNEARDTSTIQVLDYPVIPTKKSRPRRIVCILLGCLAGLAIGVAPLLMKRWRGNPANLGVKATS